MTRYTRWFRHVIFGGRWDREPVDRVDIAYALLISACLLAAFLAFPVTLVVMMAVL